MAMAFKILSALKSKKNNRDLFFTGKRWISFMVKRKKGIDVIH
jgi:hypothetical protein